MILFGKRFSLMNEAEAGGSGGGAVGAAGAGAGGEAAAAEFTASLALASAHESHEAKTQREAGEALVNEANGWIDPAKGSVSYEKTGDAALDIALDFVARAGFSHQHPAIQAAANGDFGLLSALLAEKGVQGWEQHLNLAKEAYGRFQDQAKVKNEDIKAACLHAAGDEKTWAGTLAWASANAEPDEKTAVNAALAQGGVVAQAMAQFLVGQYRSAAGVTVTPQRNAVNPASASARAGSGSAPLSPAEYSREVAKLRQSGHQVEGSKEYAALQSRRLAYRG